MSDVAIMCKKTITVSLKLHLKIRNIGCKLGPSDVAIFLSFLLSFAKTTTNMTKQ
jgi:hypothetical protein